ncbi:MAG: cobamide remodeling phosphodiesterase CbiR [bacterium]
MQPSYKIGTTSYIIDGDIPANVRYLGGIVDDVELVLFDDPVHGSNIPDQTVIKQLINYAVEYNLTYTVHLPMDVGHDPRSHSLAKQVIAVTKPLNPVAFIMHFDGETLTNNPYTETKICWQNDARKWLKEIITFVGDPKLVCIENLEGWEPEIFDDIVTESGVSRCVDVGHLWLENRDPLPYLQKHLSNTRVIHLHGIGDRDHQSLSYTDKSKISAVLALLNQENYTGIVTLEIFGEEDFLSSMRVLDEIELQQD